MGGDAGVCVVDGLDPGDRLRGPEVSVSCQQGQDLLDRAGGGDPVYPEQLAGHHGRKRWLSVRDTFAVQVAPGENDVLVLASVLALDLAEDAERRDP
jgi:hypothetical protein